MKKIEENKLAELNRCITVPCVSCAICNAINFEERRKALPDRGEQHQLYSAELLSYYFHLPALTSLAK
jgi:hypothetical protein